MALSLSLFSFLLSFRSQTPAISLACHTNTVRRPRSLFQEHGDDDEANLPRLRYSLHHTCSHSPVKLTGVVSKANIHTAARIQVLTQYGHLGSSRNGPSGRGQRRHTRVLCHKISHTECVHITVCKELVLYI